MTDPADLTRIVIVALAAGMLAQVLSGFLRLPSIIPLLLFGIALGPDALGVVVPSHLGSGLEVVVTLSVALILFEGSMTLKLRHLREVKRSVRRLVTVGALLTLAGASVAALVIAGLEPKLALLFGALVSVTGPTVIRPLVRRIPLRREVATILEGEGILIDPVGAILAVVFLELALGTSSDPLTYLGGFAARLGVGAAVGAAAGGITALIVRFYKSGQEHGLKNLVVIACALGCYGLSESVHPESGLMAVVVGGLVAQLGVRPQDRELRLFKEQITTLLLSILFILLAANLRLDSMRQEGWAGLATILTVMLVIRPLNVFFCIPGPELSVREKIFLSWVAPRGIVAASVASLSAFKLGREGIAGADRVESLVFMTILLTVILQGSTASLLARFLGIRTRERGRVLVVGANPLARLVGSLFRAEGRAVTVIDTNPDHIRRAVAEGLDTVQGSALDRDALQQARPEEADTFIACTENVKVNELAAHIARTELDLHHVYVALDSADRVKLDPLLERAGVRAAFGRPIPLSSWASDIEDGTAAAERLKSGRNETLPLDKGFLAPTEVCLPLAVKREGHLSLCAGGLKPAPGDEIHCLIRPPLTQAQPAATGVLSS